MTATMTAEKAFRKVEKSAEKIRNDETAVVGTVSVGDTVRQGDVYLVCIGGLPKTLTPISNRQLAPGDTQGSRHILEGDCRIYDADKAETMALVQKALAPRTVNLAAPLIGPVFECLGDVEVTHPEHGNRVLPAGEKFAVVYQRAFANEVRRQID